MKKKRQIYFCIISCFVFPELPDDSINKYYIIWYLLFETGQFLTPIHYKCDQKQQT